MLSTGESDPGRAEAAAARLHAEAVLEARPREAARPATRSPGEELDVLFARYIGWARSQGRDARYLKEQQIQFSAHFAPRWRRLRHLTSSAIARYQSERGDDGISSVTLYKELVTLSRFLKWARREKLIDAIPEFERPTQVSDYQVPDLRRQDVARLLAALPDRAAHPKHHPAREFATWLWSMALRLDEGRSIQWRDVDLERAQLTVRAEIDKAGRTWVLPLTEEAVALLTLEARRPHHSSDPVFNVRSVRASFNTASAALAVEDAKSGKSPAFPHVTPHHLRHARISEWANGTRRLASVQFMARHLSIATTAKYVRAGTAQAKQMLDEIAADSETDRRRIPIHLAVARPSKRAASPSVGARGGTRTRTPKGSRS